MAWGDSHDYPRAILHIDGDSFFASCEVAKDPALRGKPVITGRERGIVSSMTYEARALGIRRSMPLHEIAKKFPEVIILASDYETYSLFSNRMYEIVRRYTPAVEEYSIDECFADLTGMRRVHRCDYPEMAARIKVEIERDLGITFSMGLSVTKTLAKIGSKWKKPSGLTAIPLSDAEDFLRQTEVGKVWGIGPSTAAYLQKFGIRSAQDLVRRPEVWVRSNLSKPGVELWYELNGKVMNELDTAGRKTYQSISKTKTFTPPSRDPRFIFSELSKNIENACIKLRRWELATPEIFFFLKTQKFKYHTCSITLSHATCVPEDILREVREYFLKLYKRGEEYRATGVSFFKLENMHATQLDLFGSVLKSKAMECVYESVDEMCAKYGKHAIFLASSFAAMTRDVQGERGERGGPSTESGVRFRGETDRRRIGLAYLGDVK